MDQGRFPGGGVGGGGGGGGGGAGGGALRRVVHAARRAGDAVAVFEEAAPVLARTLPFDVWAGVLLDPVTLFNVGGSFRHGVGAAWLPRMLDIEYREGDVNLMPQLARQEAPVGSLATALDVRMG
ncbi:MULTISPECIES: hypothetical protein [Kitasatospora]|uniref:Uncharacterized protein n=1 Tax=Kitasatospora setae (strain ATCC 33774 / DSM 43861 / JCM 3304 / KCC A-0304 / NBRC 14216 / KM-6054) TaxID=452652 RepID=E4N6Y5_KITSK|nr:MULTISPECIES: hypothetical protein [Kitasatospora]BAJ26966.1 hypothetical protein KSE_11320 [Kitasatospora setae KM-6054]